MASGHRHWQARLRRLAALPSLSRAERRQLRKQLGRLWGVEWRTFGNITRRWEYLGWERLPDTTLAGEPQYQEIAVSRAAGWHRRYRVVAERVAAVDALNTLIATRAQELGHVGERLRGGAR